MAKKTKTGGLTSSAKLELVGKSDNEDKDSKDIKLQDLGRKFEIMAAQFTDQVKKTAKEVGIIVEVHVLIEPQ